MSSIRESLAEANAVAARAAQELAPVLERMLAATYDCLHGGHKILACGNGGSAAQAQHLVAELVGRFGAERPPLAAIALSADSAILTALGNDYGYERVFSRQVQALALPGDLLFAISTSGSSPNVVRAAETAHSLGCSVLALTGMGGGELARHADLVLAAPSNVVARIQEVHVLSVHVLIAALDELIARRGLS